MLAVVIVDRRTGAGGLRGRRRRPVTPAPGGSAGATVGLDGRAAAGLRAEPRRLRRCSRRTTRGTRTSRSCRSGSDSATPDRRTSARRARPKLHPDFGGGGAYGIPFKVVPATQPKVADPLHGVRRRERSRARSRSRRTRRSRAGRRARRPARARAAAGHVPSLRARARVLGGQPLERRRRASTGT